MKIIKSNENAFAYAEISQEEYKKIKKKAEQELKREFKIIFVSNEKIINEKKDATP